MKYCQLVFGSAGTGKSTYCKAIQDHGAVVGRTIRVGSLDPAAENFKYSKSFDIRDLISVDDVMEELQFGPNGALIYCMEFLIQNLEWLQEQLDSFLEDDYLIIDCPGQLELFTHLPIFKSIVHILSNNGWNVCGVYLIDAVFLTDASKFIAANLMTLSCMIHLEIPYINLLSKVDLIDMNSILHYLSPNSQDLIQELNLLKNISKKYRLLNTILAEILDDYDMVTFLPVSIYNEELIENVMLHIDNTLQYGEDMEPKEPEDGEHDGNEIDQFYEGEGHLEDFSEKDQF
jgi:GPN-loop GTPase